MYKQSTISSTYRLYQEMISKYSIDEAQQDIRLVMNKKMNFRMFNKKYNRKFTSNESMKGSLRRLGSLLTQIPNLTNYEKTNISILKNAYQRKPIGGGIISIPKFGLADLFPFSNFSIKQSRIMIMLESSYSMKYSHANLEIIKNFAYTIYSKLQLYNQYNKPKILSVRMSIKYTDSSKSKHYFSTKGVGIAEIDEEIIKMILSLSLQTPNAWNEISPKNAEYISSLHGKNPSVKITRIEKVILKYSFV